MSTLPHRSIHVPAVPGLSRLAAALALLVEVLAEADDMAANARKRHPFGGL